MPKQIQLNGIILDGVLYDEPPESLLLLPLPLPLLFAIAYGNGNSAHTWSNGENREREKTHQPNSREEKYGMEEVK